LFSVVVTLNKEGYLSKWFGKTIIHSDRRFSYEEAQDIIEGNSGDYEAEILILDKTAKKMRSKRIKEGSIEMGGS
jgi:ribonuclease R